jgi:hypothetical protein
LGTKGRATERKKTQNTGEELKTNFLQECRKTKETKEEEEGNEKVISWR